MSDTNEILERIAVGIERLAEDPVIQMETGPPVCPHCERVNPNVRVNESGGSGPLAEFVIQASCLHCGRTFYALPVQWQCAAQLSHVEPLLQQLKELSGYGNNGKDNPTED